jgi:hypothetical protein
MRLEPFLLVLALAPWSRQTPSAQDVKPFPLSDSAQAALVEERIDGAWQLLKAVAPGFPLFPGDTEGFALFHDGYLSLEIHGISQVALDDSDGEFFQTGFHRYAFDGTGWMDTFSLIGVTNLTEDEDIVFEPAGGRRRFKVSLVEDQLTLERTDGTLLTFKRLGKLPFPGAVEQLDAFGRPVPPKNGAPAPEKKN